MHHFLRRCVHLNDVRCLDANLVVVGLVLASSHLCHSGVDLEEFECVLDSFKLDIIPLRDMKRYNLYKFPTYTAI